MVSVELPCARFALNCKHQAITEGQCCALPTSSLLIQHALCRAGGMGVAREAPYMHSADRCAAGCSVPSNVYAIAEIQAYTLWSGDRCNTDVACKQSINYIESPGDHR